MTATEVRADAVLRLAEWHREGLLPDADADLMLRAIFTGVEPTVYRVHWDRLIQLVTEEHGIRSGKWDDTEFGRLDRYSRTVAAEQWADEVHSEAVEQARSCAMVATRHAAQKYLTTGAVA